METIVLKVKILFMAGGTKMKRLNTVALKLLITLSLVFEFSSCTNFLVGRLDRPNVLNTTLGNLFATAEEEVSLLPPELIIVSKGMYSKEIKILWTPVENAECYTIERAAIKLNSDGTYPLPTEDDFKRLATDVVSSNYVYTDQIILSENNITDEYKTRYYYRICSENRSKKLESSEFTNPLDKNTDGLGFLFAPVTDVVADKGKSKDSITVKWTGSEKSVSYDIYRGMNENGTGMEYYKSVITNTYFTDSISPADQGKEFYYKVISRNFENVESLASPIAMGYTLEDGAPPIPNNLRVTNYNAVSTDYFELKWDAVQGFDTSKLKYNIYRNSNKDSQMRLIKKELSGNSSSYNDSDDIEMSVTYYYYLQTVYKDEDKTLKSAFSETGPDSKTPVFAYLLSAPLNCVAEDNPNDDSTMILKWTPSVGYDCNHFRYNVYKCDTLNGTYTLIATINDTLSSNNMIETIVSRENFYKVTCLNSNDLESSFSNAFAPAPLAPINVKASKNEGAYGKANSNGVYNVIVTWDVQDGENPSYFNIYRSTNPVDGFKRINDSPISGSTRSYNDASENMKPGIYYYYRVVSLNFAEYGTKGNTPSEESKGYGAITRDQWFFEYNKTVKSSQKKLSLMHKKKDTDKLGKETIYGVTGSLLYDAHMSGLGAEIIMEYSNYCDFYINNDPNLGPYFLFVGGNTNSKCSMDSSGMMNGTVTCKGMYPGKANYDHLEIKGGGAGGGYYSVETYDLSGKTILEFGNVDWKIGEL